MPHDRRYNRRQVLAGAGAAGATLVAGCSSGSNGGSDVYEIGMVDALTGSLSDFGTRNQRGMELALADINEVGVAGGELDIIVEDSGSTDSD